MKIGFDASDLCTNRADGTTRYTQELLTRLPHLGSADTWEVFGPCVAPGSYETNVSWHASPWPMYWTQSRFPLDVWKVNPEVLFMPIQQLPFIRRPKMKTVAVIHDLAIHQFGEQFPYKDWLLLNVFGSLAIREADALIAVSQATADDIAKYYGRTEHVHVVHHGVDHNRFKLLSQEDKEQSWTVLKEKYPRMRKPYILYVGQIQPRKNIERLIEAFELLKKNQADLQLVIAGSHGWHQQPIEERVKSSPYAQDILMLGRVADELLPSLYSHAEVFTLVSLYEGFGMPILEAFASGIPVVTSNNSSMKEIAERAAILVDPYNSESIADGISQAMHDKENLKQKGIERAKQFTWEKTAQETYNVIASVSN